jgi:hypothetical protein
MENEIALLDEVQIFVSNFKAATWLFVKDASPERVGANLSVLLVSFNNDRAAL